MLKTCKGYYSIINSEKKQVGVPAFLDAPLHDAFYPDGLSRGMDYAWNWPVVENQVIGDDPLGFPSELWLIANHRRLVFDPTV